jgi:hypothetical protein
VLPIRALLAGSLSFLASSAREAGGRGLAQSQNQFCGGVPLYSRENVSRVLTTSRLIEPLDSPQENDTEPFSHPGERCVLVST